MKPTFKRLTTPDEIFQASFMAVRPEDMVEFIGISGLPWQIGLNSALIDSDALWGCYLGEKIIAVGGILVRNGYICPWFVGSPESHNYPIAWIRFGKNLVKIFREFDMPFFNYVWKENLITQKWLTYIGFEVDTSKSYEYYHGIEYYKFTLGGD